ncbi:MAG: phenylalanine--tRNA ligase subunit alpha [Planctomycetota bacterium]|nr:MAG: phenylalanine--tRNA ligase subunit alpha [Planctomycetota bacterium]
MRERLEELRREALAIVAEAGEEARLREVEVRFLGRNGEITGLLRQLGSLPADQRPAAGREANLVKAALQEALDQRRDQLQQASLARELRGEGFDPTLPGPPPPAGALHPLSQVQRRLEDLFSSMGFLVADGPEVEWESYNFDALNIPPDHPAREAQDTIFVRAPQATAEASAAAESDGKADGVVLRSHTSTVQIRALKKHGPPLRVVAPGRVFRQEAQDATHEHTFHQMEGLVVDRGVGVAHMLHAMNSLLEGLFGRKLETRLRPGFFPFVEPGFELDARCPFCDSGCRVCKGSTWIELMPGGLVHPNVLEACDVDPEVYSGYAFGLGLSRVVMLSYGIDDIRWLLSGDLRFLRQFPS